MLVEGGRSGRDVPLLAAVGAESAPGLWEPQPGGGVPCGLLSLHVKGAGPGGNQQSPSKRDHFLPLLPLTHFLQVASVIPLPLGKPQERVHLIRKWLARR